MQPFKKALSWLSGIAMVGGSLIEVLQKSGIIFAPDTIYGKAIFTAGLVVLFLRNLTADKDGDGTPDILQGGSKLGALLLVIGLAACTPSPAVASPRPFGAPLEIVADTVRLTFAPCDADEPTVACRVTVAGTVGQTPIVFPAVADVAVGGTAVVTATFACTALQTISVTATSRGVNRSGQVSDPQTATATTACPDGAPNVPRSFTIQITVVRP